MPPNDHDTIEGQTMHPASGPADFPTTRWTLVAAAGHHEPPESRGALSALCEAYRSFYFEHYRENRSLQNIFL